MTLRPLADSDYKWMRDLELSETLIQRYRHRGTTPSPEHYESLAHASVLCQFAIVDDFDGSPQGLVVAYNADMRNSHCYIAAISPDSRPGLGAVALVEFITYVMDAFPFRKLYGEVLAPNMAQFRGAVERGLATIEGVLKENDYLEGAYHDRIIVAIYRTTWMKWSKDRKTAGLNGGPLKTPSTQEFCDRIQEICKPSIPSITLDTSLLDLELDSLGMIEFLILCESMSGESFDASALSRWNSLHDAYDAVLAKSIAP